MKKKMALTSMIIASVISAVTVFAAKLPNDSIDELLEKKGLTQEDRWAVDAIIVNSDENVIDFILQKYEKLKDWDKVREAYGIDKKVYDNFIEGQRNWQQIIDAVPDSVMNAMVNEGWSRNEISGFINRMNVNEIDCSYAWEQYKSGKTLDEIVKEKTEQDKKLSELDTAYIMNDIPETEYWNAVAKIKGDDSTTISEILMQVKTLRTEVRERHRKQSGITDEEIKYCESVGMTNPMDMFQAKYIAVGNKVSFENVVETKLKNEDWISATAEVLKIPKDEYEKQVKQAISE